jgi:hypothetical protein
LGVRRWEAVGQLDALEELSLWNCNLGGPIAAASLCQLRHLRVLAVSQNALRGTLPECIAALPLERVWLDGNRIHGPISEYSSLGQYLKSVNSLNLGQNRWAPLLWTEKAALEAVAKTLGVTAEKDGWAGHIWEFSETYEWIGAPTMDGVRRIVEREVSYRYWGEGVPFDTAFWISLPRFIMSTHRGAVLWVGPDGDLSVGDESDLWTSLEQRCAVSAKSCGELGWAVSRAPDEYLGTELVCGNSLMGDGCTTGPWQEAYDTCAKVGARMCTLLEMQRGEAAGTGCGWNSHPVWSADQCPAAGHMVIANGNENDQPGECRSDDDVSIGRKSIAFRCCADSVIEDDVYCALGAKSIANPPDTSCWTTLPELVPELHVISEAPEVATSNQGADYLSERFCPDWAKFIAPAACDPRQPDCSSDESIASAVFDGGGDMYDLGNILTTSLMGDCTSDPHGCPLGSLHFRSDFAPVDTSCFGPGGQYQMTKLNGVWVFLAHNAADTPLDFVVAGNLGSDGSGTVTEYTFEVAPYIGFIKRECGAGDDPSVNHLTIVDTSAGRLTHSCDHTATAACSGSSSDIDDDAISGIAPGSLILYLLYSSEGGRCIKEDEHRAVFDAAVRCLWAEDPFNALHQSRQAADQPLVEVTVDDQGHIVFGGTAPYMGWSHGSAPRRVPGLGTFPTALQFGERQHLQLGESGVEAAELSWTLDCYVQVDTHVLRNLVGDGILLASADGVVYVSSTDITDGLITPLSDGWHRLTIQVEQVEQHERSSTTLLIDGAVGGPVSVSESTSTTTYEGTNIVETGVDSVGSWGGTCTCPDGEDYQVGDNYDSCGSLACVGGRAGTCGRNNPGGSGVRVTCHRPKNPSFFAVGGLPDGSSPFPLPICHLRLYSGVVTPPDLSGSVQADACAPLSYHEANSRWVEISRGTDAVEVAWRNFGRGVTAHDETRITLEPSGSLLLHGANSSQLWDRAVTSASGMTDARVVTNWTSVALAAAGFTDDLRILHVESDPCYDLWEGIECSLSDWPVGRTDCAERLDCATLGWDPETTGSAAVCGTSSALKSSGDTCVREVPSTDASELCRQMGARLCTVDELQRGEADPETCGYDSVLAWTWADGDEMNGCPRGNQSLGVAGAIGGWYSFSAAEPGAHEIQLRTDGDCSHSISTDIVDNDAEVVHTVEPPTLHRRADGVMVRWNITQGGGPYYVLVTSRDVASPFSMIAVSPQSYEWQQAEAGALLDASGSTEIRVAPGTTVVVDLGFSFPFFGLAHDRVWISPAGYLAFERPSETDGFMGMGSVYSAIAAAAGEFNFSRPGARLSLTLGAAGAQVTWHAPLYNSFKFTDTAVSLDADGTIRIQWDRISLSGGGSLAHGLVLWLPCDTVVRPAAWHESDSLAVFVTPDVSPKRRDGVLTGAWTIEGGDNRTVVVDAPGPSPCADDANGTLQAISMNCATLQIWLGDCDFDLEPLGMPEGTTPRGLCPLSCGDCDADMTDPSSCVDDAAGKLQAFGMDCKAGDCDLDLSAMPGMPEGTTARGLCPVTCGNCEVVCVDDADGRVQSLGKGNCPGIVAGLERFGNGCDFDLAGLGMPGEGTTAREQCPLSCGECETEPATSGRFVLVKQKMGWKDARDYCRTHYHDLASFHSEEENALAATLCQAHSITHGYCGTHCWIGLNDREVNRRYEWSDFTAYDYQPPSYRPDSAVSVTNVMCAPSTGTANGYGLGAWADRPQRHKSSALCERIASPVLFPTSNQNGLGSALRLTDDARIELPPLTIGGSVTVQAWTQLNTFWDSTEGITIFNSFESTACGDSDACRNALGGVPDSYGWLAVGNDVAAGRPADLWAAGVVFDRTDGALFWEGAWEQWFLVTFTVSGQAMRAYGGDQLRAIGELQAPLPRMLRENNYIGAGHGAPFRAKDAGIILMISHLRLYDRCLTAAEVVALFADPLGKHSACCIDAGVRSAFGVGDIDLTPQAMGVATTGEPTAVTVSSQALGRGSTESGSGSECGSTRVQETRNVDICSNFVPVSDCHGTISDGIGSYAAQTDCAVRLAGLAGTQYTLIFDEFDLEAGVDFLRVYDGADETAPLLGAFSGTLAALTDCEDIESGAAWNDMVELSAPFLPGGLTSCAQVQPYCNNCGNMPPGMCEQTCPRTCQICLASRSLTSSGQDLYLRFTSNGNGQAAGFHATFECTPPLAYWSPAMVCVGFGVLSL